MKFTIKNGIGVNRCSLRFGYEDYSGDLRYRSFQHAVNELGDPKEVYIAAYLHNHYYNCTECVQQKQMQKEWTISQVKEFIKETLNILNWKL